MIDLAGRVKDPVKASPEGVLPDDFAHQPQVTGCAGPFLFIEVAVLMRQGRYG